LAAPTDDEPEENVAAAPAPAATAPAAPAPVQAEDGAIWIPPPPPAADASVPTGSSDVSDVFGRALEEGRTGY
jgi:hypothetical protein